MPKEPTTTRRSIWDFLKLGVIGALLLLFPWVFYVFRMNVRPLRIRRPSLRRFLIACPIYYLVSLAGIHYLFPNDYPYAAVFHILVLLEIVGQYMGFSLLQTTTNQIAIFGAIAFVSVSAFIGLTRVHGQLERTGSSFSLPSRDTTDDSSEENSGVVSNFVSSKEYFSIDYSDFITEYWGNPEHKFAQFDQNQSVLVLGQPGAGKTNTIKWLASQMDDESDEDPFVIFDFKDDYKELFSEDELEYVSVTGSTWTWNIFEEAETAEDYYEIALELFTDDQQSGRNEFFTDAARSVFVAALLYLEREKVRPTNKDLVDFFQDTPYDEIYEKLSSVDRGGSVESINPDAPRTAVGTIETVNQHVQKVFTGQFAERGSDSIRGYMENPDGKKLLLDVDFTRMESEAPAFRFFIDWAIRHGLNDSNQNSYYILDEFQRVPNLRQIENLTGAGRGQQAQAVLGLQSIAQLEASYDEALATSIVGGSTQEILMRSSDQSTLEYIRSRVGTNLRTVRQDRPEGLFDTVLSPNVQDVVQEEQLISTSEIQSFRVGEGIIIDSNGCSRARIEEYTRG